MDPARELRLARRRAGLTQAGLAGRAGTSQATLSAYESGAKTPSIRTLERLLAATGARLRVEHDHQPVRLPSRREEERIARQLSDVLALAAALPTKHDRELRYPRLDRR